jgi:predicted transposase YdaD
VATIMLYKLSTLSREEIEAMLGLDRLESRALREEAEKGEARGRQEGERSLVLRLLARSVGSIPDLFVTQIHILSLDQLESLGEALLDFTALADLETWLQSDDRLAVGDPV